MQTLSRPPLGGLSWPVRRSFAAYVGALADGRIELGAGAAIVPGWDVVFAEDRVDRTDDGAWIATFAGSVRYRGHGGLLDVTIGAPRLRIDGSEAEIDVVTAPDGSGARRRIAVGRIARDAREHEWIADDLRLTRDGAALFGDMYAAGDPLDAFVVRIPAAVTEAGDDPARRDR